MIKCGHKNVNSEYQVCMPITKGLNSSVLDFNDEVLPGCVMYESVHVLFVSPLFLNRDNVRAMMSAISKHISDCL